jgi:hypothetical protein
MDCVVTHTWRKLREDGWMDRWMDGLIEWGQATPLDTRHSKVFIRKINK